MSYLGSLGLEFENPRVIFEISPVEVALLQNFAKNQTCLKLGQKMSYLGVCQREFQKSIVIFEITTLKFV